MIFAVLMNIGEVCTYYTHRFKINIIKMVLNKRNRRALGDAVMNPERQAHRHTDT